MQHIVESLNTIIINVCHILAMFTIFTGVVKGTYIYIKDAILKKAAASAIQESRNELGHAFSLGLGFLIGASILKTSLAPQWNDIGQLSAIIAIRTILTHFLLKDIKKKTKDSDE